MAPEGIDDQLAHGDTGALVVRVSRLLARVLAAVGEYEQTATCFTVPRTKLIAEDLREHRDGRGAGAPLRRQDVAAARAAGSALRAVAPVIGGSHRHARRRGRRAIRTVL